MARAMFGAGCFWAVEAAFRWVPGVRETRVGFSGGTEPQPSFESVATGRTGHAQVVCIEYDEQRIAYEDLLAVFWRIHDATPIDRQDTCVGPQHRSVIFHFDDHQRRTAETSRAARARASGHRGADRTEIAPAGPFHPAEEHHQRYYEKRGQMARSLFRR